MTTDTTPATDSPSPLWHTTAVPTTQDDATPETSRAQRLRDLTGYYAWRLA